MAEKIESQGPIPEEVWSAIEVLMRQFGHNAIQHVVDETKTIIEEGMSGNEPVLIKAYKEAGFEYTLAHPNDTSEGRLRLAQGWQSQQGWE